MTKTSKLASDGKFNRLYTLSEIANMPLRERNQYETLLRHHWDNLSDKYTTKVRLKREREEGKAEGLQEGREKGKAEGERKKALSMAKKMKSKGYSVEEISDMTDLSLEEILKL